MYANAGYHASLSYSSEDDDNIECDSCLSLDSDEDSEQELHDVEELLYSHLHYEPNYLCKRGSLDYINCLDVQITEVGDRVSDRLDNDIPGAASEQKISDPKNSADSKVVITDAREPLDEVVNNTAVTNHSDVEQLKRKPTSCENCETADEIKTKYKKVDTAFPSNVVLDATAAESRWSTKLLGNAAGKQEAKNRTKKKLKAKHKSGLSRVSAAVDTGDLIVLDSVSVSSSSSSDAFCCDQSSEELPSDEADDIKLSNINVDLLQSSEADALIEVLNSLPGVLCCQQQLNKNS